MAEFYVGQKVVCVDASFNKDVPSYPGWPLVEGGVYDVTGIGTGAFEMPTLKLAGVHYAATKLSEFYACRFRPVQEQSKGMEILRAIVADPGKPIPEDPREPVLTPNEAASIPGGLL